MDNFNSTLRKLDCVNELLGKYVPPTKSIHLRRTIPWNFTSKTRNTAPSASWFCIVSNSFALYPCITNINAQQRQHMSVEKFQ